MGRLTREYESRGLGFRKRSFVAQNRCKWDHNVRLSENSRLEVLMLTEYQMNGILYSFISVLILGKLELWSYCLHSASLVSATVQEDPTFCLFSLLVCESH